MPSTHAGRANGATAHDDGTKVGQYGTVRLRRLRLPDLFGLGRVGPASGQSRRRLREALRRPDGLHELPRRRRDGREHSLGRNGRQTVLGISVPLQVKVLREEVRDRDREQAKDETDA